ncbi:hypothetical protein EVAR_41405_1 [Eumeta japonica]|uniref:Uncharacterized protein n=1 Tax=Eumeta variegata TaxID=151549 RepID=A0A4C1WXM6_EUMVA|nr:hypothetical protein EVAR_41405_1 [Eumeta japonica]
MNRENACTSLRQYKVEKSESSWWCRKGLIFVLTLLGHGPVSIAPLPSHMHPPRPFRFECRGSDLKPSTPVKRWSGAVDDHRHGIATTA